LKELSKNELKEVDGGWFIEVMVAGLIYDILSNPSSSAGFAKSGFNYVHNL